MPVYFLNKKLAETMTNNFVVAGPKCGKQSKDLQNAFVSCLKKKMLTAPPQEYLHIIIMFTYTHNILEEWLTN